MDLTQRSIELTDKLHADLLRAIDEGHPGHAKALLRILVDHTDSLREHAKLCDNNAERYRRLMRVSQGYAVAVTVMSLIVAVAMIFCGAKEVR